MLPANCNHVINILPAYQVLADLHGHIHFEGDALACGGKLFRCRDAFCCRQVYEDDNYLYIVMEACMGGELFDLIIKRGHFSEQDAANVASVVLQVQSAGLRAHIFSA